MSSRTGSSPMEILWGPRLAFAIVSWGFPTESVVKVIAERARSVHAPAPRTCPGSAPPCFFLPPDPRAAFVLWVTTITPQWNLTAKSRMTMRNSETAAGLLASATYAQRAGSMTIRIGLVFSAASITSSHPSKTVGRALYNGVYGSGPKMGLRMPRCST